MGSQRRVFRNNINNDHLRSPYARDSSLRTPKASRVAPKVSSDQKDRRKIEQKLIQHLDSWKYI